MPRTRVNDAPTGISIQTYQLGPDITVAVGAGTRLTQFQTTGQQNHRLSWSSGDTGTVQVGDTTYRLNDLCAYYAAPGTPTTVIKDPTSAIVGITLVCTPNVPILSQRYVFSFAEPPLQLFLALRQSLLNNVEPDPIPLFQAINEASVQDQRLNQALDLIHSQIDSPPTNQELSNALRLDPSHVRRLFQAELSVSPKAHIHQARLQAAKQLLTKAKSVQEVVDRLNVQSHSTFTRDFQNLFHQTPKQLMSGKEQ